MSRIRYIEKTPKGVSWSNNPSFPLKASEASLKEKLGLKVHNNQATPKGLHIHKCVCISKCNPFGVASYGC